MIYDLINSTFYHLRMEYNNIKHNSTDPTNTRNDGEGRPDGWIPANEEELQGVVGWTLGYPTVLASDLNKRLLIETTPKEQDKESDASNEGMEVVETGSEKDLDHDETESIQNDEVDRGHE